jgi:gentisate 1,2-dioxygenase
MTTTATNPSVPGFDSRLADLHLVPLWRLADEILPPEPTPSAHPAHWRYADVRDALFESARAEAGEEEAEAAEAAERRVLLLVNPGLGGRVATTPTLVAGLQLLLPGEDAPTHRHTAAAVRFVIEGRGASTVVDGVRTPMEPGDVVLTPNWSWHDHHGGRGEPVVWLDVLDLPLVRSLQVGFFERPAEPCSPPATATDQDPSPLVVSYPWSVAHRALVARADGAPGTDGMVTLDYADPVTGGPVTPTLGCRAHLLRPGRTSRRRQETASAVVHVVQGEGESRIGDVDVAWSEGDVFVVPGWAPTVHANRSESAPALLVAVTDEPALRALDLYRCA